MTNADDDEQPTQAFLMGREVGAHRVHASIRSTASSELLLATSLATGTSVIMKILSPARRRDPGAIAAMLAEASIMRRVGEHPRVLTLIGSLSLPGYGPALLLTDLGGDVVTLLEHIRGRLPLSVAESVDLVAQLCDALAHVHGCGVIHRDVKPTNILVVRRPFAALRLIDFGSAIVKGDPCFDGSAQGTLCYMAPENARLVASELDERVDLFSVGILLYFLLTGSKPYRVTSMAELRCLVATPMPPSELVPGVPEPLSTIVLSLISLDPAARPASAKLVAYSLRAIALTAGSSQGSSTLASQEPTLIHPATQCAFPDPPDFVPAPRRDLRIVGGVVAALVVAAALVTSIPTAAPTRLPLTPSAPPLPRPAAARGVASPATAPDTSTALAAAASPTIQPPAAQPLAAPLQLARTASPHARRDGPTTTLPGRRTACTDPFAPCGSLQTPRERRPVVTPRDCDDARSPCAR